MSHVEIIQLFGLVTLVTALVMALVKHKACIHKLEHNVSELTWDVHDLRTVIADLVPEIESKPFHSMSSAEQRAMMTVITKLREDSESTARSQNTESTARKQRFKPVIVPSGPPCDPPISGKPYR